MIPGKKRSGETPLPPTVGCLPANCVLNRNTNIGGISSIKNEKPFRTMYRYSLRTTAATGGDNKLRASACPYVVEVVRIAVCVGEELSLSSSPLYCAANLIQSRTLKKRTYAIRPTTPIASALKSCSAVPARARPAKEPGNAARYGTIFLPSGRRTFPS